MSPIIAGTYFMPRAGKKKRTASGADTRKWAIFGFIDRDERA
jgi:hypothetical protein